MSYENNNNNSQDLDLEREGRSSANPSRDANRYRKNQQMQKNETRSAQHSSSGVSVGMTKPPVKPSFIIAAVTIFLVVIISVIFIIRSLPEASQTTPDVTTPAPTTPAPTTPAPTTPPVTDPDNTTPAPTTPAPTTPAPTTPPVTDPANTTPAPTTPGVTDPDNTTPAPTTPSVTTPADTTSVTPPVPAYRDVSYPNAAVKNGILAAISSANPVVLPAEKLVDPSDKSVQYYEHLPYAKFSFYEGQRVVALRNFLMYMTRDTAASLDNMLYDFVVATGGFSATNATRVGKPLLFKAFDESDLSDEFALGTVIWLKVNDGNATLTFSEADGYTWIYDHAHEYGFVLRFPEGKEEVTGEQFNDGIFRYVGIPHATAMHELGMCYEEYLEAMKTTYTVENPYQVSYENMDTGAMESYLIYYVAASGNAATTDIPVYEDAAEDAITITGNGTSGFIVTVKE